MTTEQMDAVDATRQQPSASTAVAAPERGTGTDLVLRDDQTMWDEKQLAALRSIGVQDAPNAELALFFHQAKRTGLDPFSRQIYMIQRKGKWGIQTAIDGFRTIRDRPGIDGLPRGYAGQREQWCGPDGVWRDVWLEKAPPAAARVLIYRAGFIEPVPGIALWAEFAPYKDGVPQAMWGKMPALMLAKCGEALALRKAFPQDFSGLYAAEEMDQAQEGVTTLRATPHRDAAPAPASQPSTPPAAAAAIPASPGPEAGAQPSAGAAAAAGEPPADVVDRWRVHVLSREFKGSQTSRDGGMRTAFKDVRKAGLLDYPIAPGDVTFRQKMVELSAGLPEKPDESGDVPTTQAGDPQPEWGTDANGWAVAPEDQPL